MTPPAICLSIVSHGQGPLVAEALADIARIGIPACKVIVTLNIPEHEDFLKYGDGLDYCVIRNLTPLGFGANHNQAFARSTSPIFAIVNPDIRLVDGKAIALRDLFSRHADLGACAPLVADGTGRLQDSARRFPTIWRIFRRVVLRQRELDYPNQDARLYPDWVAGMFVLFRREAFCAVGGFDEKYFMYLEDADICRRLTIAGWQVSLEPSATVIHDARRHSHHNFEHVQWHVASLLRFLTRKG